MIPAMKRLFVLLAACALLLAGCKDGNKGAEAPNAGQEPATKAEDAQNDFTFDELFRIFSCFGENVMSDKFAAQSVKDGIKGDLSDMYEGAVEFTGDCNVLSYSFYNDGYSDDFLMACYRCKADDHVLAMLMETGGCDVTSVKYIRAYEYDPGQGSAHEIALSFEPKPERDDFEDMIRLAGADVPALRDAMRRGSYRYEFRTDGVTVRLNDPADFNEQAYHGDLVVDYLWNGSVFVRNQDYRYACIHANGFANILLGQPAPNFYFDYDPKGYGVNYSQGGDLWLINDAEELGLEVQMDGGKVYSIECRFPEYCVARYAYEVQPGKVQPYVGARINDCLAFGTEAPQVWMLMDGTVQIEDEMWNSKIAFRTSKESLENPVEPSFNDRIRLEHPAFKPEARIESILIWQE